jgi:1,3-beta-glucan synthase
VIRFAILYFSMVVLFVVLIAGPIIAGSHIPSSLTSSIPMDLYQPTGQDNDNTLNETETGTGAASYHGIAATGTASSTKSSNKFRFV